MGDRLRTDYIGDDALINAFDLELVGAEELVILQVIKIDDMNSLTFVPLA